MIAQFNGETGRSCITIVVLNNLTYLIIDIDRIPI